MAERFEVRKNPNGPNYQIWDTVTEELADQMLFASEIYANQTAESMNRRAEKKHD